MAVAQYGSWASPFTAAVVAGQAMRLDFPRVDGDDVYWVEGRPAERGRVVLVRTSFAEIGVDAVDVTPGDFSVRTRVHEYGGLAYAVLDRTVVFCNFADQRLYRQDDADEPRPLTPGPAVEGGVRFGDLQLTPDRRRVLAVRETHGAGEVVNDIVAIRLDADGDDPGDVLASGHDFFAFPRLSPDGRALAWIAWDQPQMPWDGTELWVTDIERDFEMSKARRIAGGVDESVFQPEWSPDGVLHFISDRSGWWNLYRAGDGGVDGAVALAPRAAEFGVPLWVLGLTTYGFLADGRIVCTWSEGGRDRLGLLDAGDGRGGPLTEIDQPYTTIGDIVVAGSQAVFVGASGSLPESVVAVQVSDSTPMVLGRSTDLELDPADVSRADPIEFATTGGRTAHAYYYPPVNPRFDGPDGERPPLVVMSHGGPTSATRSALNLGVQFWTSRGLAVVDVNYGGSTGYGRAYRQQLNGTWGIVDVDDCIAAAHHLADRGLVDSARTVIRGGSAGGWTTLCALTFRDEFVAGANYFGVADAAALARDTHKFEARYLDSLIGPWPEAEALYEARSPIHFVDQLSCPVIVFQGLDDAVVPPSQSEMIVDALRAKGIPVAYIAFEGEAHGFRQAASQQRAYEAELSFYAQILGFPLGDDIPPVMIENLPALE